MRAVTAQTAGAAVGAAVAGGPIPIAADGGVDER